MLVIYHDRAVVSEWARPAPSPRPRAVRRILIHFGCSECHCSRRLYLQQVSEDLLKSIGIYVYSFWQTLVTVKIIINKVDTFGFYGYPYLVLFIVSQCISCIWNGGQTDVKQTLIVKEIGNITEVTSNSRFILHRFLPGETLLLFMGRYLFFSVIALTHNTAFCPGSNIPIILMMCLATIKSACYTLIWKTGKLVAWNCGVKNKFTRNVLIFQLVWDHETAALYRKGKTKEPTFLLVL